MSIFTKIVQASEARLDAIIEKSKVSTAASGEPKTILDRKGIIDLSYPEDEQYGYKERPGMVGNVVLKSMGRKDSVVRAIISTRLAQIKPFTKQQEDPYSPGWKIKPVEPADLTDDDKMKLADPSLDDPSYEKMKYEMEQKLVTIKAKQDKDIAKIVEFIKHSGMPSDETDTTKKRWDFSKVVRSIVEDRLIYNYMAIELIPTKDGKLHHYYPISAGTIKYISEKSADQYAKMLKEENDRRTQASRQSTDKKLRYVQIVRGKIVAAFTEDELIFEPANPTTDPEDNGYAPGELEYLLQIVTAHLYAEAHNRNFFTQGIGTKGILHIKGDNISRAQLEAFKRQWFSQVVNTRNAFRPPIIGMADEVKWVSLAQTNREMEFEAWMNYLIKICCAIYQIDPAEINFDIAKTNASTLQESNNEDRLKNSKDKGLRPILDMIEEVVNDHIIRYWDKKLADQYKFEFVGFQAESRQQEIDRLDKETKVWKTLNEARIEMGAAPLDDGDVVLNATYTQYKAQKLQQKQADDQAQDPNAVPGQNPDEENQDPSGMGDDMKSLSDEIDQALGETDDQSDKEEKKADQQAKEDAKKSQPTVVEYFIKKDE